MIPVRLCDIPLDVRRAHIHAAFSLGKRTEEAFLQIVAAAAEPSDNVYFVSFDKAPLVAELVEREAA